MYYYCPMIVCGAMVRKNDVILESIAVVTAVIARWVKVENTSSQRCRGFCRLVHLRSGSVRTSRERSESKPRATSSCSNEFRQSLAAVIVGLSAHAKKCEACVWVYSREDLTKHFPFVDAGPRRGTSL